MTEFEDAVIEVVSSIEHGSVMTYGEVAEEAGRPGAARGVGRVLRVTDADIPWWRVVTASGRLTSPVADRQAERLRREGWPIDGPPYRLPSTPPADRPY